MKGLGRLLRSPFLSVGAVGQLVQYQRRGFHPNDRDTSELVTRWRHELFGSVDEATATDGAESRVGSDANRRVARSGQGQNGGPVNGPSARLTGTDATGPAT